MRLDVVPGPADLEQIAAQVWSSYLDPDGDRPLMLQPSGHAHAEVVAIVGVSGAWDGRVMIGCSSAMARLAAAALLGIGSDEVAAADVTDAMGELANVIGGNVKGLMPEPSVLSLPVVRLVTAGDPIPSHAEDDEISRIEATWLGEPLTVTVLDGPLHPGGVITV